MSVCKNAEDDGIFVLHGNRGSFHNEKQPAFKAIYSSFEKVSYRVEYLIYQNPEIYLFNYSTLLTMI